MKGKEKCELLKSIRREIAEKNGIKLEMPECTHKGDCLGSCPRCESEVKYLERQLELRRKIGIKPIVAGISAGLITLTASSCIPHPVDDELQGDMRAPESTDTTAHEITEYYAATGSLTFSETEEDTGKKDTEIYVLDGDIAFPPGDELEWEGVMALPEDEMATVGDLVLPIESDSASIIQSGAVTADENCESPETTGDDTTGDSLFEASTEYAADTVED